MDARTFSDVVTQATMVLLDLDSHDDLTGDLVDVAEALDSVRALVAAARQLEALPNARLADEVHRPTSFVGPYRLERKGGTQRKAWDSDGVFSTLIRQANVDPATGEVRSDADAREALIAAMRECFPLTGSTGWRTGALRSHGIDPGDYCTETRAPYRFEVHLVDVDAEAMAS